MHWVQGRKTKGTCKFVVVPKHHAMKTYTGMKENLYTFLT